MTQLAHDPASDARTELWRRHDAGEIGADELEARLQGLDRATEPDAIAAAIDGPVSIRRRLGSGRGRRKLAAAVVTLAVLAAGTGAVVAASAWDGGGGSTGQREVRVEVGKPPIRIPVPPRPPGTGPGRVTVEPAIPVPTLAPGNAVKCDPGANAPTDQPAGATITTIPVCE